MRATTACLLVALVGCGASPPDSDEPTADEAAAPTAEPVAAAEEPVIRWAPLRGESFERAAHPTVEAACGPEIAAVASALGVVDVSSCAVSAYGHGAERLLLVSFDYGPVEDCPSGCFQESASAILLRGRAIAVPSSRLSFGSPYNLVRDYLQRELAARSLPTQHTNGTWFDFFMDEGWCANRHELQFLESQGDSVCWVVEVPPTRCTPRLAGPDAPRAPYDVLLEGAILVPLVPATGSYAAPRFERLELTVQPVP
ncbi:MAG: hypothetical protein KC619_04560 [Myxococcales bacterium]|nr:hypothetical protein [Myxococcales bacterium]